MTLGSFYLYLIYSILNYCTNLIKIKIMNKFKEPEDGIEKINIMIRSFQSGADEDSFDFKFFEDRLVKNIKNLLNYPEIINKIIVITNGEEGNPLAEKIIGDNLTPTVKNLKKVFPQEVESGLIVPFISMSWGNNPGSGDALNQGLKTIDDECKWILMLSAEMDIDGYKIMSAINFARERDLSVVGFMRNLWWERPQWNVGQNTACLWNINTIRDAGGFDKNCDKGEEKVKTAEYGEVPLAGMEDFHAMLRLMNKYGDEFRWGMIGRFAPLKWNTQFEPGSERERNHQIKVARQYIVIRRYVEKIFPDMKFEEVMEKFFSLRHQD